jgi:two-component system sensor histidine kinase KdpD
VYLGSAPGVGKTYAMLAEAHRRRARGTDVVVGFVQTYDRPNTERLLEGLEVMPGRTLPYRGTTRTELDVDAVLARYPQVVLVDELAHANALGSRNARRWQDVEELLDAGIDVVSTVNVAHLESLQDVVEAITGVRPTETVPDEVVRRADQIELVDMSPEALRRRIAHGNVLGPDTVATGLAHFFRPGNLTALRELALLWLADRVDDALAAYRAQHGIDVPWPARERVVVGLTGDDGDEVLLRRGAQIARRTTGGELLAVHVSRPDRRSGRWSADRSAERSAEWSAERSAALDGDRELVAGLGGSFHSVVGVDPARALLDFARGANASQIVVGAGRRHRGPRRFGQTVGEAVSRHSGPIDVHLVTLDREQRPGGGPDWRARAGAGRGARAGAGRGARGDAGGGARADAGGRAAGTSPRWGGPVSLGPRRRLTGWALALAGPLVLVAVMSVGRDRLSLSTHAMVFLLLTVTVALLGGLWPALVAAVAGGLLLNWFFTPPYATLTIADPQNAFTLVAFVLVGAAVSSVVDLAARRSQQAGRSAREAEVLSLLARSALQGDDSADAVLSRLGQTLQMTTACLLERTDDHEPWRPVASWGGPPCTSPETSAESVTLTPGLVLAMQGRKLPADDRRMLEAFAAQAAVLLERQRLRQRALQTAELAHGNAVRTALLAAVSHAVGLGQGGDQQPAPA